MLFLLCCLEEIHGRGEVTEATPGKRQRGAKRGQTFQKDPQSDKKMGRVPEYLT